ncbi:MAG TPA: hypothetical protein VE338_19520 [Ktedonobacterales bacterium]|nr:hypothetical protein [Ktedonobacterales bacterium]
MSVAREERDTPDDVAAVEGASRAQSRVAGRWLALIVAVTVVAVLVAGWLVDVVGAVGPAQATGAMTQAMTQQVGLATVALSVNAPSSSSQAFVLQVKDASGAAEEGAHIECALSMPGMAMAIPTISAAATGQPGWYRCVAPALSPGRWSLALTITMPSGEIDHATFSFDVA